MSKVTIYSIAETMGIAASTVSRALNRPELVKPALRQQIREKAEELGYHPNHTARRLATGRRGAIGVLVPDITNPYFPPLVRALQSARSSDDESTIVLMDAKGSPGEEPALIKRLAGQVDGIILASPLADADPIKDALGRTPAVLLNREIDGLPAVAGDVRGALWEAGEHVVGLGHTHVAVLAGTMGSWAAQQRRDAIVAWAAESGTRLTELGPFEASYDGGYTAAAELLHTQATAAFAFDDLTACGVVAGLSAAGTSVPDGCSVIGCDDVLLARVLTPTLSTVSIPNEELGRAANTMLASLIRGEQPESIRLQGIFVARASTGPARQKLR